MQTKSQKVLPKTTGEISNGGLYEQSVRCGKRNCKCASGQLHSGYYYFYTRIQGKLRKYYVHKDAVADFSHLLAQSAAERNEHLSSRQRSSQLLRELTDTLRGMATSKISCPLKSEDAAE